MALHDVVRDAASCDDSLFFDNCPLAAVVYQMVCVVDIIGSVLDFSVFLQQLSSTLVPAILKQTVIHQLSLCGARYR